MTVTLPDGVLEATKLTEGELVRELAITLFQQERLTLGQAAQLCALPQLDFQRLVGLLLAGSLIHYGLEEMLQDLRRVEALA